MFMYVYGYSCFGLTILDVVHFLNTPHSITFIFQKIYDQLISPFQVLHWFLNIFRIFLTYCYGLVILNTASVAKTPLTSQELCPRNVTDAKYITNIAAKFM